LPSNFKMMDKSDNFYIEKVLNNDLNAYAFLVDRHKDMVFSIALRILKNREDAEELAQDVFVKAFQSLTTFKKESKFSTWLYRIVFNAAISKTRKKQIKWSELDHQMIENYSEDEIKEDVDRLNDDEKKKIVDSLFQILSPEESTLITLYYYNDMQIEEIGLITGLSEANVKVRLHRLRKRMFTELQSRVQKSKKEISR
jgi:RNA polymerase sigma factor (sigma-70 family)